MKKILGLDLGTNSIGWAVINSEENTSSNAEPKGEIIAAGSRIIPMDAATLSDFDKGNTKSQTAERTRLRLVRRNIERSHLRRERLNRVLNLMGFLPEHYAKCLDRYGKLKNNSEPKIAWVPISDSNHNEFLFTEAFEEMVAEFKRYRPELIQIPHDWTLYYLRKKALTKKISKEELAWVLHSFNQKRGYYQLRGKEEVKKNKEEKYYALRVTKVVDSGNKQGKKTLFDVHLENGFIYHYTSEKVPKWEGKVREFIVTTTLDDKGQPLLTKDGQVKRNFRMPKEEDWGLRKICTQEQIDESHLTVGEFIYNTLLHRPQQKVRGEYVRIIDRHYYKKELRLILKKQSELHPEFHDKTLLQECALALYPSNEAHRSNLLRRDLSALLLEDVLFYQRPLKSQKNQIDSCPYEFREYVDKETGEIIKSGINCISRSHPLFQEFRLWQFIGNLHLYERLSHTADGQLRTDVDVTSHYLSNPAAYAKLFTFLNSKASVKQDQILRYFKLKADQYRWNYVEDKVYPANETRAMILTRLKKANISEDFLTPERETSLWHILYSVSDRIELEKALGKFADKNGITYTTFVDCFKKCPPFDSQYGAYSAKAIKRLLPLMRIGSYWSAEYIDTVTMKRIQKIINGEFDENIPTRVREKAITLNTIESYQGLPLWLACYVVYGRHSEAKEILKWDNYHDIDDYLQKTFKQHSLRNPIVEQVVLETLRVVRDIWKDERVEHFDEIHVELGREMKNPADKRKKMTDQATQNEWTNLRIKALLTEFMNSEFEVEGVRPHSPSQQEILRIYEDEVLEQERGNMPKDIEDILKKFHEMDEKKRPTHNEILRYKLWLEQKYRSPYTGEIISLGKLFTSAYQIEHIIPQALYFDNSYSNKVICETEVNQLKSNSLGMQFIEQNKGRKVKCAFGKVVTIFMPAAYQEFVQQTYAHNPRKMKNLLATELPDNFTNRQLNDSRYISKLITTLLSNIVREKNEENRYEDAAVSKNVIVCTGQVTDRLKKDWGFNDVWNNIIYPRFERLNQMEKSERFGHWEVKQGKRVFQTDVPLELQRGFNRKRIDHRHHALDAITIACATRNMVNYLSNQSGQGHGQTSRHDLQHLLCRKQKQDEAGNYRWIMKKPWKTITQDTLRCLQDIVVSFKQNLRVVNKTNNRYEHYNPETGKKERTLQTKGDHLSIRKPLHEDTFYGLVNIRKQKAVKLSVALQTPERIVDKVIKRKVFELLLINYTPKLIEKYFVENKSLWPNLDAKKVLIYYFTNEVKEERIVASRKALSSKIKIEKITNKNIRTILEQHLDRYEGNKENAFSPEGLEYLNNHIRDYNNDKFHHPIYRVRIGETLGQKFVVGNSGNKNKKYVVTAQGTNLFFAIYLKEDGKRTYETIPLNIVIERQKQGLSAVPEKNTNGDSLLFVLSPNDLVYLPTAEEIDSKLDFNHLNKNRFYKMVSCNGNRCSFIPYNVANPIYPSFEFNANNKIEISLTGESIKEICIPIQIDRLGNISK